MQVVVEKFGTLARFGFMHLIATNVSLWIRTVVWESANEWLHYLHHQQKNNGGVFLEPVSSTAALQRAVSPYTSSDYMFFDDVLEPPVARSFDYETGTRLLSEPNS